MEEDAHGTYCSNSYRLGSCTEWRCLRPSFPVVLHLSPAETKDFMHLRDDVSYAALQVFGRAFPTSFNFRAVRESCLTLEGLDSCQAPPSQKGTCKTGEKAGGKRTTSLFNSCCSNNTKTLHVFVALSPLVQGSMDGYWDKTFSWNFQSKLRNLSWILDLFDDTEAWILARYKRSLFAAHVERQSY